ncbi:Kazal-type serine protease inhibitor domain-containing protein [Rhizobium sp. Root482]|uniref:Kazal-type serine protease inhibitor domain-containing protein n=1 Tax=Rhizobium sp. Root482 TaxID=1736543 RepID=UPI0006F9B009|nr:Kazal-type serine protease inhibitor domain-containing protein [Rhizobium sp. Root482]KQY26818.1 hypothetical protein ASD31_01065 [Rhizobium sp. Root482]
MMSFRRGVIRMGALVALSLGLLSACTVVEESGPRPPRPRPSSPQMCTMEYDPVCGQRGGDRQTFSNACQARADGYRIVGRGECRRERPEPDRDRPQVCTREYDPVCARKGRREQTFANACTARADGFQVIGRGECRRSDSRPDDTGMRPDRDPDRRPQMCTMEYDPVCARQGRRERTFANACSAKAEGFRVTGAGSCR